MASRIRSTNSARHLIALAEVLSALLALMWLGGKHKEISACKS